MKKIGTKILMEAAVVIAIALALIMPSSVATTNEQPNMVASVVSSSQTSMVDWYEDFDNYTLGQYLENESDPADGGWHGWCNDLAAGAYVVDDQARSTPHSVEILDDADLVHEYDVNEGQWVCTAWQFIPEATFIGASYFIMLCNYNDSNGTNQWWSVQVKFDSISGQAESEGDGAIWPIIFDEWVEIRVEIDLEDDLQKFYYDGVLYVEKSWSEGLSGPGAMAQTSIQALDLFANLATAVYYDDISLVEVIPGDTELEISDIAGGFGVKAVIKNVGEGEATDVEWSIKLDGGLIILGKETTGTITSIPAEDEAPIKSGLIFGIGKTTITVSAECAEGSSDEGTANGFVLLFFVLGVQ